MAAAEQIAEDRGITKVAALKLLNAPINNLAQLLQQNGYAAEPEYSKYSYNCSLIYATHMQM